MRRLLSIVFVACGAQSADTQTHPQQQPPSGAITSSVRMPQATTARLGANVTSSGVVFRVWAPHATSASVQGDFSEQTVAMTSEGGGVFSATVADAHAGTTYRFTFDSPSGTITRIDPYCRQELADGSGCTVIDPSAYAWKNPTFVRPARNATVVYELHVGSFAVAQGAPNGTFADVSGGVAGLADLGVNAIELMPVQSFGGNVNTWGYNPQLYFAPKSGYGAADDLRALIDTAHGGGIGVWLDTVINHTDRWSLAPLACFDGDCATGWNGIYFFAPGPYAMTPWGPRPDYTQPYVSKMILDSVSGWLEELHGDGFRWDSVSNIRALDGSGTTPGGRDLLVAANALTHSQGAMSIAEDLKGWSGITQPAQSGGFGFDAQWDSFGYDVTGVLAQTSDDARDLGVIQNDLLGGYAGDPFARLLLLEDHDTVGNGGARLPNKIDPVTPTSLWARKRSMLGGVLLLTTPGVPMLFMGEESLATGTFTNPPTPLASSIPPQLGDKMRAFYKDMIALRRNTGSLSGGLLDASVDILHRNDTNKVIAYRRHGASGEDVVVVVNLRNKAYTEYDVGVPSGGAWRIRLDTDWMTYGADFGGGQTGSVVALAAQKDGQPYTLPVQLSAYGAVIFSR